MREPIDDPAHLTFRSRNHARTVRQGSQAVWIVVTLVGAVLFVLLIRMLLERTSATIGGSVTNVPTETNEVGSSSVAGSYAAPAASTPDEVAHPSTGMVYRCVGKGGEISLQSEPCGPDARMTKAVHAPPERELPRRMRHASKATANANALGPQYARVSQSNTGQGTGDACAQARRSREETLERVGLARTYDLLQRLDSMVNDACK